VQANYNLVITGNNSGAKLCIPVPIVAKKINLEMSQKAELCFQQGSLRAFFCTEEISIYRFKFCKIICTLLDRWTRM
jgi:hypothetical protein